MADIWWGDNEQHGWIDDVVGDCIRERIEMGFHSRSAGYFGGVWDDGLSRVLSHDLPTVDVHPSIPPLSFLFGIVLFCSDFL